MCLLIVCETMFTVGDSRVISSSKHKWLEILTREDFPPKLLSSDNGFLKFNADNEEEICFKPPVPRFFAVFKDELTTRKSRKAFFLQPKL